MKRWMIKMHRRHNSYLQFAWLTINEWVIIPSWEWENRKINAHQRIVNEVLKGRFFELKIRWLWWAELNIQLRIAKLYTDGK